MVRFTKSWLVAVVALGFVVGAACNKSGTSAGGDDLSLIPVDSEMVIGLNFAQLEQSALWKQYSPKIMDEMAGKLAEFKTTCGFDPVAAVKSMTLGMKNLDKPGTKPEGVLVVHGLDKTKMLACADKYKAEAAKNGTDVTVDGDVILIKEKDGTTAVTFIDSSTAIGVVGPNATKDSVKAAAKGGSALKSSQTFVDMFKKINANDSVWMMVNGNSGLLDKAAAVGVKPKAVFGSLNVTDGLALDARIRLESSDAASSFVTMIKGEIDSPQVKAMFDKLEVTPDGADAHVVVAMSNQKLQALVGMVGGMLGGLMGGGMGGPSAP